jgi:hypothetical protein
VHQRSAVKEKRSHPNSTNPFCATSVLNLPLKLELCQRIHAAALARVARDHTMHLVPSRINRTRLSECMQQYGLEACLEHPAEIEQIFQGITSAVYQEIESLYCSRLERSISMTSRIVKALAEQCGVHPIHEEAVWAICLYLDERLVEQTEVTIHQLSLIWWIGVLQPQASPSSGEATTSTSLIGVIDASHSCLLTFRIGESQSKADLCALALYDAHCDTRRPHPYGAGGLIWNVPRTLVTQIQLPERCYNACASLGIQIESSEHSIPYARTLAEQWRELQNQRKITPERWAIVFDSYLNSRYGTSPLRAREYANYSFRHLIGYTSDPAALVPGLRTLLTPQKAEISQAGDILYDGLHYVHDLLALFPERSVLIRRSESTEAVIWVYLESDILCQAMARELARHDGSYRSQRIAR